MEAGALELRFRGPGPDDGPPDVSAFCKRAGAGTPLLYAPPEEVGVLPGRRPLGERTPLVIFFQHRDYGIPAIVDAAIGPSVAAWNVRRMVPGYLACLPRARRARATWVVSACLPVALVGEAAAAPSDKATTIQRPKTPSSRPVVEVETPPPVEPEPPVEPPTDAPPDPDSPLATEGDAVDTPPPAPPEPPKNDAAIVDAAWEGVDGFDVELKLRGGIRMRGRVGAVQRDTFTLIQAESGAVLVLAKSSVASLRVRTAPKVPERTGGGLIAGGVVMTTVAVPTFIAGVVFLGICPSCMKIHLPLIIIGGGLLGGGIPMLVRGTALRRKYLRALDQNQLTPVVGRTPYGGWTGGLRFRF
jgi:hypothetical protein